MQLNQNQMVRNIIFFFVPLFVMTFSCNTKKRSGTEELKISEILQYSSADYAERFRTGSIADIKILEVFKPWPGSTDTFRYFLYKNKPPEIDPGKNEFLIKVPVDEMVCFSTTHLPALEMLGSLDKLTGFPNTSYISSPAIRQRVEDGFIKDLGPSNDINFETLIALDPDLIMAFSMGNEQSLINKLVISGLPVVLNADYLEKHPLGRAEWIKATALFLGKEKKADSLFAYISKEYNKVKEKADQTTERPTVFTGVVYGDTWFMPGGEHYGSIFFQDAGSSYLWTDNPSSETLQLSFESVYEKAANADYWVGTATFTSLEEIKQADERYTHFKAYQTGKVYNYTAKMRPGGGNPYFEKGYARPDMILKDMVKIFHPQEMEDYEYYFYEKLN